MEYRHGVAKRRQDSGWVELDESTSNERVLTPMDFETNDLRKDDIEEASRRYEQRWKQRGHVEHLDRPSGEMNRELSHNYNASTPAKHIRNYTNGDDTTRDNDSSSDSDDSDVVTNEAMFSHFKTQRNSEDPESYPCSESMTYQTRVSPCNVQKSLKVVFKKENSKMEDDDALWGGICSKQEPSKETDYTTISRNKAETEMEREKTRWKDMPKSQTVDSQNGCLVRWKNSPKERPWSDQKESPGYVEERGKIVRGRKAYFYDDNEPDIEHHQKVHSDSVVRWKGSSVQRPLPKRNQDLQKAGKLHWIGDEMPFKSSCHLISETRTNPTPFPHRSDRRFDQFPQVDSDTKRKINKCDDQDGAEECYYNEQDSRCSRCGGINGREGNDSRRIDLEALSTEKRSTGTAPSQVKQSVSLKACGPKVHIRQRNYQVQEREIILDCGDQHLQTAKEMLHSDSHQQWKCIDEITPYTYFKQKTQRREERPDPQIMRGDSSNSHDVNSGISSNTGRMVKDNDWVGIQSAHSDPNGRRDSKTAGNQQRNSQHLKQKNLLKGEQYSPAYKSYVKSASSCNIARESDVDFQAKPKSGRSEETDRTVFMKPCNRGREDYDGYNERGKHLPQGNRGTDRQYQRWSSQHYEEQNLPKYEEYSNIPVSWEGHGHLQFDCHAGRRKSGYNKFADSNDTSESRISKDFPQGCRARNQRSDSRHSADVSSQKTPNRSPGRENTNDRRRWENRKSAEMNESSWSAEPHWNYTFKNDAAERGSSQLYSYEGGEEEAVRDESEDLERLVFLFENRVSCSEGQSSMSKQKLKDLRSAHEREMNDARDSAIAVLNDYGLRLSENIVSSRMVMQIFRVIYKEWLPSRNVTLALLTHLDERVRKDENWKTSFNTFCNFMRKAGEWAIELLQFTPYKTVVNQAVKVVPPLLQKAKELITTVKRNVEDDSQQHSILQVLQRDIHLSSELGTFAVQYESQFRETVKLFVEFRNFVLQEQMADFVEDIGLVSFIIDLYSSDPESENFFHQMSDAYRKFHSSREGGLRNSNSGAIFCSFIDDDPSILDMIPLMDWRFTQSFQNPTTETAVNSCWADINSLVSSITERPTDALRVIANIIRILQDQKSDIDKNVSRLY